MTALVVYVFFATWCTPCRHELPAVAALSRDWEPRGVRFVLVSSDGPSTAAEVAPFLARFGLGDAEVVLDSDSALTERLNPTATLPYVAVVDASGRVVYSHAGYEPGDERKLEAALAREVLVAPAAAAPDTPPPAPPIVWRGAAQTLALARRDDFAATGDGGEVNAGITRLELAAARGGARAMARVDGALFRGDTDDSDARVEKLALEVGVGPLGALAGDSYASLGHGLLLSVRKVDPLGVDTTVRGGRLELRAGRLGVTALAGVMNPQNVDVIDLRAEDDPDDLVAGLELRQTLARGVVLGQAAVVGRAAQAAPDGADLDSFLGGLSLSLAREGLRVAAEVVGGARTAVVFGEARSPAYGAFASVAWDVGPTTLLVEGKWYRRLFVGRPDRELFYNEPPTLERDDQEVPGNADSAGGRLRGEWRVTPEVVLHASALAYLFRDDGGDPLEGGRAVHLYAGGEARTPAGASAALAVGVRDEDEPDGADRLRFVELDADAALPVGHLALTAKWDHHFEEKVLFSGPRRFLRGLGVAGLAWPGRGALSATWGYSDEVADRPVHYPGGELRVLLGGHGDVRLFVGRQVGGRICVSGACRDLPPFEGARLEVVLRL